MNVHPQFIFCILVSCMQKAATASINLPYDLRSPDFYTERAEKLSLPLVFQKVAEDAEVVPDLGVKLGERINLDINADIFYGVKIDTGAPVLIQKTSLEGVNNVQTLWGSLSEYMLQPLTSSAEAGYVVFEHPEGYFLSDLLLRLAPSSLVTTGIFKEVFNLLVTLHQRNMCLNDLRAENIFITAAGQVKLVNFADVKLEADKCDNDIKGLVSLNMSILGIEVNNGPYQFDFVNLEGPLLTLIWNNASMVSSGTLQNEKLKHVKGYFKDCTEGKTSINQYFFIDPAACNVFVAKHAGMLDLPSDFERPKSFVVHEKGEYLSVLMKREYLLKSPYSSALHLAAKIAAPIYYLHSRGLCHGNIDANNVFLSKSSAVYLTSFGNYSNLDENCEDVRNLGLLLTEYLRSPVALKSEHFSDVKTDEIFSISQQNGATIDDILNVLDLNTWIEAPIYVDFVYQSRLMGVFKGLPLSMILRVDERGRRYIVKRRSRENSTEFNALNAIPTHKNVVTFLGMDPTYKAIRIEYIDGNDIEDFFLFGSPNFPALIAFIKQLTDGLDHIHSSGICHKDLHGNNIRVAYDGVVKIIDFNVSKKFKDIRNTDRCEDLAEFSSRILFLQGYSEERLDPAAKSHVDSLKFPVLKRILQDALSSQYASILKNSSIFKNMDDDLSVNLMKHYANNATSYGIYEIYTMPIQSDQSSSIFAYYPNMNHVPLSLIPGSDIVQVRGHYLGKLLSRRQAPLIPEISKFIVDLLSLTKTMQSRKVCHGRISDSVIFIRSNKTRDLILMSFNPVGGDMDKCTDVEESKEIFRNVLKILPSTNVSIENFVNIMNETSDINALLEHATKLNVIPRNEYKCERILNEILHELKEDPTYTLEKHVAAFIGCLGEANISKDEATLYQDLLLQAGDQYFENPRNMAEGEFTIENAEFSRHLLVYQNAVSERSINSE